MCTMRCTLITPVKGLPATTASEDSIFENRGCPSVNLPSKKTPSEMMFHCPKLARETSHEVKEVILLSKVCIHTGVPEGWTLAMKRSM